MIKQKIVAETGNAMKKVIAVNREKCLGCHSCELSCARAHSGKDTLVEAIYDRTIGAVSRVFVERVDGKTMPIQCCHCEDAPCVAVCPSKALTRIDDASPVLINADRCIGCHACIIACPFGVIKTGIDGRTVVKCDLCAERLEAGKQPACVEGCPTGAIQFVSVNEAAKERRVSFLAQAQKGAGYEKPEQ